MTKIYILVFLMAALIVLYIILKYRQDNQNKKK